MSDDRKPTGGIAIIGTAGRFPGARDTDEFWRNLCAGAEGISFFHDSEAADVRAAESPTDRLRVSARGILEHADLFDAAFFGVKPREAETMDPQHRVFLECAWAALENAGYDSKRFDGPIGVFAGMSMNTYLANNLASHPELIALVGDYQTMLGNDKDFLPTRVSYKLGLTGPSLNIQTACSTSLVAVCVACQHLLSYQCDLALAGAVSIRFPQRQGYWYQQGGIASPDGHCRPFDAKAAGTVPGEGVGIVVLKRLEDAVASGDLIYAVIRGFATNNDGCNKVGFTAPSVHGQAEVIAQAQAMAGVEPDTIGYVEAHGTGTPLGDPIEVEALTRAFRDRTKKEHFCALGSVKSNIGHLDTAAGVAGLIKAALALHNKKIPATLHFEAPNPQIEFARSPFFVSSTVREWERDSTPRRAGVSSFGIGGTNAHVVLEEAPALAVASPSRPAQLLMLSAKTGAALERATGRLAEHLRRNPDLNLADVAYTLQLGRRELPYRRFLVCHDVGEARLALSNREAPAGESLGAYEGNTRGIRGVYEGYTGGLGGVSAGLRTVDGTARERAPRVVFMFPGQGAQQVHMGREVYRTEPVFRKEMDGCCEILNPLLGFDVRSVLFPGEGREEWAARRLNETAVTQPVLFMIEYALAKLWMSWSIVPESMIGHSIGEYVAACLSGVFSLEHGLKLIAERGRLMQQQPAGAMLAVRMREEELQPKLNGSLSMAAVNGAMSCVASGPTECVESLRRDLESTGVPVKLLSVSHAFHSAMMEPVLGPFTGIAETVTMRNPKVPFVSNVTGRWITEREAVEPAYWAKHLRQTVRFAEGIGQLLHDTERVFLEVGPGETLSNLAKQHPARTQTTLVLSSLPRGCEEEDALLNTLGRLWLAGVPVDWQGFYANESRRRVPLPTYPFEPTRYWVEPRKVAEPCHIVSEPEPAKEVPAEAKPLGAASMDAPRSRQEQIIGELRALLTGLSGLDLAGMSNTMSFAEMGFESLFLTQASLAIEKKFGVRVAFRQLIEDANCLSKLAPFIDERLPASGGCQGTPGIEAKGLPPNCIAPADTSDGADRSGIIVKTVPLTPAQSELWFTSQISGAASCAFNESRLLEWSGPMDSHALCSALQKLVDRHEALRTTFTAAGDVQAIHARLELVVAVTDLSDAPEEEAAERLQEAQRADANQPFDLVTGPLIRAQLFTLPRGRHALLLTVHHIVCDGHSFARLLGELASFYAEHVGGRPRLQAPPLQFSDYVQEKERAQTSDGGGAAEKFWVDAFKNGAPVLQLPTDSPRPRGWTFEGARAFHSLPASLTPGLKQLNALHGCTFFMTLLASWAVLLKRLSGQSDIVVGVPIADRSVPGGDSVIGHCTNFLPLRIAVPDGGSFVEHLLSVRKLFLDAYEHQRFTFGSLLQKLKLARNGDRMPLVSVTLNFEQGLDKSVLSGLGATVSANPYSSTNFDLSLNVAESDGALRLECRYNKTLFTPETIQRWLGHFQMLLESVAGNPSQRVEQVPLLTPAERQRILVEWNATRVAYPREKTIAQLFDEQVARTPNAVAVECGDRRLTYQELDRQANQVAHYLQKTGVGPDGLVAVLLDRSIKMIVAWVGILKAGGAYVPLDPAHPKARLASLLEDCRARVLLTKGEHRKRLELDKICPHTLCLDTDRADLERMEKTAPRSSASAEHLAYVSFTSGSTGAPKGVCVPNRAVARLVINTNYVQLGAADVVAQISNCAFDASTFEVWGALLNGARLQIIPPQLVLSPKEFRRELQRTGVSAMFVTSALFNQLTQDEPGIFSSVRNLLVGGDAVNPRRVADVLRNGPPGRLLNGYGPTECTTFAVCHDLHDVQENDRTVPIGRPIANTEAFVLDANRQPVPIGVLGELYLGGDGLARGYLKRPELTAEKFVPHPFSSEPGARLYRTGDVVRYRPDGVLEFIGRTDHQVKVRGFRVEPGETEVVLAGHPKVRECVVSVAAEPNGDKRLIAHVVPKASPAPAIEELRDFLRTRVPEYMIPSAFLFVPELPLNANGKLDRAALPAPDAGRSRGDKQFAAPGDATELQLAEIWEELLSTRPIGLNDNFFELGGHSLLALRLLARVEKRMGKALPIASLFQSPTLGEFARLIRSSDTVMPRENSSIVPIQPKGSKPPLFLVHGVGGGMFWGYANLARHLGEDQPVYAFRSRGVDGAQEFSTIEEMAAHYLKDLRAFQPQGPYYLGGYCFGGNVACEMARSLKAQGEEVALLALMNAIPPGSRYWNPACSLRWLTRFMANLGYLLHWHFHRTPEQRRGFVAWQVNTLRGRLRRRFGAKRSARPTIAEFVDLSGCSPEERPLWDAHVQALFKHRTKSYTGHALLLRSRGHQFWCSFDAAYGWRDYITKGLEVRIVAGAHEQILEEPFVHSMAEELKRGLEEAAQRQGVAAGILPAVKGGILPPGAPLEDCGTANPPGRMPGSTAGRMPAATTAGDGNASMHRPATEPAKLEVDCTQARLEFDRSATLDRLFEAQVVRTPEATALIAGTDHLTYRDLNARAEQLAGHLRALEVGPEVLVGICVSRSWRMVAGILAILKAGGAYVPMDPAYPKDRLAFVLADAQPRVLITERNLLTLFNAPDQSAASREVVCIDEDWDSFGEISERDTKDTAANLAYVIYTSGSTGRPKGVAIEHRSAVALMHWARESYTREEFAGVLGATSICFDLSVFEMFLPLSWGGTLILAENALALASLPAAKEVTLVNTVPSAMRELLRLKAVPASVRVVNLAGEPLPTALADQIYRETSAQKVYDLYGPSETTTYSTGALRKPGDSPTIGRALTNQQVYLLDADLKPVPTGAQGEVYIGGEGLARGYLRRPELTAEKFIASPFRSGERLYRTGDLGRWRADGNLEFLGRLDHQVKIRGYRIELGEIETVLRQHPDLAEAMVVVREPAPGDKRLVGYLAPRPGKTVSADAVRGFLKARLPEHMIPSDVVFLEKLPLTPNGKVDRKALPEVVESRPNGRALVAARTPLEMSLVAIWREVLGRTEISIDDNFFELGGQSLLATQVISRIRAELHLAPPLSCVFDAPTIAGLAERLSAGEWGRNGSSLPPLQPVPRSGVLPASFVQERLWFLDQLQPGGQAYNVPIALRLRGVLDRNALGRALDELIRRHEALRTVFVMREGNLCQVIQSPFHLTLRSIDLHEQSADRREQKARKVMLEEVRRPLELGQGPLIRGVLVQLGASDHILGIIMHHTVSDGWSLAIFFKELEVLYTAFAAGRSAPALPELPIQCADFAVWRRKTMSGEVLEAELAWWKDALKGAPPSVELPVDHSVAAGILPAVEPGILPGGIAAGRPSSLDPGGKMPPSTAGRMPAGTGQANDQDAARAVARLPREFSVALSRFCQEQASTPFMICLAALAVTLQKWTRQNDLVLGTVVAGRNHRELENVIGCFVNFLPLRLRVCEGETGRDVLSRTRAAVLDAQAHQECPFQSIVQAVNPKRRADQNPLYNVALLLQNFPARLFQTPALESELVPVEAEAPLLDLRFEAEEADDGLRLMCEYKTSLFRQETIEQLLASFLNVLETLVRHPETKVAEFPVSAELVEQPKTASPPTGRISSPPPPFPVAAGILPAVEPGILPGGMTVPHDSSAGPGGKMPRSTAGRMPAATGGQSPEVPLPAQTDKIAVTATFTAEFLGEPLRYWVNELELPAVVEFAPYGQVFQQLLNPNSLLARNERGLNVVLVRIEDWHRSGAREGGSSQFVEHLKRSIQEFTAALKTASARNGSTFLVCFCPPSKEITRKPELAGVLQGLEDSLAGDLRKLNGVQVITHSELLELYPVPEYDDPRAEVLGHVPYTSAFFAALATMVVRRFHALKRPPCKVIALDCDQTLWSGICGEDGPAGVQLDPPRRELQLFMRRQLDAGRLLCLCSKNNEEDVVAVFERMKDMPLQPEHFVARQINWRSKSENLRALAAELNLGLESFVLLDDNPMECAEVAANCPEVMALHLPEEPALIPQFLKHCWLLDGAGSTSEDARRTALYQQNRQREALGRESLSLADFLKSLELRIDMRPLAAEDLPRVSQLTLRTNQFNTTSRRRNEAELLRFQEEGCDIRTVRVADRFGDYGLVGVLISKLEKASVEVDAFMLSCRVLGKGVEHQMLAHLGTLAGERGLSSVDIHFVPSAKNKPARDFLESVGAQFRQALNGGFVYAIPAALARSAAFRPAETGEPVATAPARAALVPSPNAVRYDRWHWVALEANDPEKVLKLARARTPVRARVETNGEPDTELEKQLCQIWQDLLRIDRVGIHDDFFELGGRSLLAVRLFAKIELTTGKRLPVVTIFQSPTVAQLAERIEGMESAQPMSPLIVPIKPQGSRVPLFLVHGAGGDAMWGYANLARRLCKEQPVYGIQPRPTDDPGKFESLEAMAADYLKELRAFQPEGPYCLGGYCFGGSLAYEMARQLDEQGQEVAFVGLLESATEGGTYRKVFWWRPDFLFRFTKNLWFCLDDFRGYAPDERRSLVRRKLRAFSRKLLRRVRRQQPAGIVDLDDIIDSTQFADHELKLWEGHLRLLSRHVSRPYAGPVTVFRTAAHPLFSSYRNDLGWGALVAGGVTVKLVTGSHANIFFEPNVSELARQLASALPSVDLAADAKQTALAI